MSFVEILLPLVSVVLLCAMNRIARYRREVRELVELGWLWKEKYLTESARARK